MRVYEPPTHPISRSRYGRQDKRVLRRPIYSEHGLTLERLRGQSNVNWRDAVMSNMGKRWPCCRTEEKKRGRASRELYTGAGVGIHHGMHQLAVVCRHRHIRTLPPLMAPSTVKKWLHRLSRSIMKSHHVHIPKYDLPIRFRPVSSQKL